MFPLLHNYNLASEPYHIIWQLVSREILHIFMVIIYDICQFSPINMLLEDPHLHCGSKLLQFFYIITYYFGNRRTPAQKKTKIVLKNYYFAVEKKRLSLKQLQIHRLFDLLPCSILI